MTALLARPQSGPGLVLLGLGLALSLRIAVAGSDGTTSAPAGLIFALALGLLAWSAGWRWGRPHPAAAALGMAGGAVLLVGPVWSRLTASISPVALPVPLFPLWASVVTLVAVGEEVVLRGALFTMIEAEWGTIPAIGVTSVAFALLHVPLYGWGALPLDLAVGCWLGALRAASGGVLAPTIAHSVADLAVWWL